MSDDISQSRAVEELQQFGLREYEAKCFVSLTKITLGTARDVSEHVDVPRTRVYEAVRSLESAGLVEIQHSSPQQFRAIPISEAIEVLNERHQTRINSIENSLRQIRESSSEDDPDEQPEIWSISGTDTITARVKRLLEQSETEVLLLIGDEAALSAPLYEELSSLVNQDVDVVVGAGSQPIQEKLLLELPESAVYDSELQWLGSSNTLTTPTIGRLLLVDDESLLISTVSRRGQTPQEHAVCGSGSHNGLVLLLRRLVDTHISS